MPTSFGKLLWFFRFFPFAPPWLEFLFHLGNLGLELVGLFQDHLNGRLLLPHLALRLGSRGRFYFRLFGIAPFRYWHRFSPVFLVAGVAGLPRPRVSGWL